ncbi:MAG: hypothetical protein KAJ42_15355 [Gemmatimonadetes bacterium]|nr:hypothetical protein [Gemmatimonadota bacterium]
MSISKTLLGATRQVFTVGETGWGPETTQILLDLIDSNNITVQKLASGALVLVPNVVSHAALAGGATMTPAASVMKVISTGGAVTLSAVTAITAGEYDEQLLDVVGTDNGDTVTIPDAGIMQINGLITLSTGTRISLAWDNGAMLWREKSRNN